MRNSDRPQDVAPPVTRTENPLACPPPRPGDTVVHLDYGLCRMGGLRRLTLSDGTVDAVELRFREDGSRHVPIADAVRLWNYGAHLPVSSLDPMSDGGWAVRQAERVMELRDSIRELSERRDSRIRRTGHAVAITDPELRRAADGFAHSLTDCQSGALEDVVGDLRADAPMNRLLIGDVGSGKTEVAVRAALAAALAGGRVRIVAPTRVLAAQHHADLAGRAEALGLRTALYSGDLSGAEQDAVVAAAPETDILVGTHALLGERFADISFALTVIDEEQKFGAKLKRVGYAPDTGSNTLRLSATPIPGTIAEARVGLASLSLIERYPSGRGVTETRVERQSDAKLRDALQTEFDRDGQVMVMAPRIKDLKRLKPVLERLFPERRFGVVHGKRGAKRNRKVLRRLAHGELDGVLATTVLETGVNLPRANTMVVVRPERFGLAQLHQLRGRVGRGGRDAYFVLLSAREPKDEFAQRLKVLMALHRRGDGLALALADAMLRGTGRFDADDDQSGHASAVGLELYDHLLRAGAQDDPFSLIPKISGDADWGLPDGEDEALDAAVTGARRGLAGQPGTDALSRLIALCRELGADSASVGPKGVVLERAGRNVRRADSLAAVLAD